MSRRGNCHENAVAESFFLLLKRERIKKKIYGTREEARSDIFDYIEMFYNSKRRHGSSDQMPPAEYENQYYRRLRSVWIIRGDSNCYLVMELNVFYNDFGWCPVITKGEYAVATQFWDSDEEDPGYVSHTRA
jgi:putative transposase